MVPLPVATQPMVPLLVVSKSVVLLSTPSQIAECPALGPATLGPLDLISFV